MSKADSNTKGEENLDTSGLSFIDRLKVAADKHDIFNLEPHEVSELKAKAAAAGDRKTPVIAAVPVKRAPVVLVPKQTTSFSDPPMPAQATPEMQAFVDKALAKAQMRGFVAFMTLYRKMKAKGMDVVMAVTAALTAIEDMTPKEQLVDELQRLETVLSSERQAFESKLHATAEVEIQKARGRQQEAHQGIEARQAQVQQLLKEITALQEVDTEAENSVAKLEHSLELTMGEFNASVSSIQQEALPLKQELGVA